MADLETYRPTPEEFEAHVDRIQEVPRGKGESAKYSIAKNDLTYFAVNQLGLKPYTWQSKFWDSLTTDAQNIIVCSARQIGKTAALAIFSLWACLFNKLPLQTTGKTRIIVVSKSDAQSKKIIGDVKEWIRIGDDRVEKVTGGTVKGFFSNQLAVGKDSTQTKGVITFANRCEIISLPATESARGYTGSILLLDEAAFFDNEEIFEQTLRPVVAQTGGRIAMTTTPNGHQGFFYSHFDPENKHKMHEFKRMWVPYTALYLDSPEIMLARDEMWKNAQARGEERAFLQEHMATFNASSASFFDVEDIDKSIMENFTYPEVFDEPCDVGVDFGNKVSRTVVTISTLVKKNDEEYIKVIYMKEYPAEEDLTLIEDLQLLSQRFNIQRYIFEECPASDTFCQAANKLGMNVHLFVPARDKAKKYFAFRAWLKRGKVKLPNLPELIAEMKGLIQEETPRTTKIYHGAGLRDDKIDSVMMSSIFYTEEKSGLRVWDY